MSSAKHEIIEKRGMPSVRWVAEQVGKHPDTIQNWYKHDRLLFDAVLDGLEYRFIYKAK